ncbi:MAG TPA: GntR family transcriptional regulator [Thermohalobaculum sp.]|nr:GntR family transcriptional regulator [Thermohalobaculum sp.]
MSKERLLRDMRRRILTLALEPGANLDETRLSAEYGISRTPLRDAFRQLQGEGYIELRDNRGAFVSPMSQKSLRDFFLTAPMIYASVARLAARTERTGDMVRLKDAQAQFRAAVEAGDAEGMVFWNDRFHFVMGEMADNQYLMPSLQRLLIDHARIGQTFWRARTPEMAERIRLAAEQHDRFIGLIEARDEEGAVALTLEHWSLSRDHLELFVRPDPLPIDLLIASGS